MERRVVQTVALILLVLWVLGFLLAPVLGGFVHLLLVIAVVLLLIHWMQGRSRPPEGRF